MKHHPFSTTVCPEKGANIPAVYAEDVKRGVPVVVMLTIGYSGHGKTCFLSSFFHSLYHDTISERWPGFSFIGLTMDTLNRIHHEYVNILDNGHLPPKTPIMFPTPLILKFQKMPLKATGFYTRFIKKLDMEQGEAIVIFYDIGGGTFDVDEKIRQNIPILKEIHSLIFLVSLPRIIEEELDGSISVVQRMHKLMNTIVLAMTDLGQRKEKNILICFTMSDEMWDRGNMLYGPLSMRFKHFTPYARDFQEYFANLEGDSEIIRQHIQTEYPPFYNALVNNFKTIRFTSVSSLGTPPTQEGQILNLSPTNVFDPLLTLFQLEGLL